MADTEFMELWEVVPFYAWASCKPYSALHNTWSVDVVFHLHPAPQMAAGH